MAEQAKAVISAGGAAAAAAATPAQSPDSALIHKALKECVQLFYRDVVRWTRGLSERNALAAEWNQLVHPKTFSWSDAAGKLWTTPKDWMAGIRYGSGAAWLAYELDVRNFRVLRHDGNLVLCSLELWQKVCVDSVVEEVTARRVTAWLKRAQDKIHLLHLHETWMEGHEPKAKSVLKKATTITTNTIPSKQNAWKQTNLPSRRRHISPRLEEFHAKPLLHENHLVGISLKGWDIGTSQGPIGNESWFSRATEELEQSAQYKLQVTAQHRRVVLPEMVFPSAHIVLERPQGDLFLSWDAMDALKEWASAHQAIPLNNSDVSYRGVSVLQSSDAKLWKSKRDTPSMSKSAEAVFHYDWTYSTPFSGKVYGNTGSSGWKQLEKSAMPMELLTDQSVPILLFDEVILLEDDLHDNGEVQLSVKLRVMPTCAFILSKLFLRVDGVLLRVRECRMLVDFGRHKLFRDITWRECKWEDLATHNLPTNLKAWAPEGNKETPAFLHLLSKVPQTSLPKDLHAHAEMMLPRKAMDGVVVQQVSACSSVAEEGTAGGEKESI
jgi:type 2A phosphatase activator TIP41